MRRRKGFYGGLLALAFLAANGCVMWKQEARNERAANAVLVDGYARQMSDNALVAERTVYPYYFVPDSADLTPLGQRNLQVLAEHFRDHPGPLNVPREGADELLYTARVDAVRAKLGEQGVDLAGMTFREGLPGGPGMSSTRVVRALEAEAGGTKTRSSTTTIVSGGGVATPAPKK